MQAVVKFKNSMGSVKGDKTDGNAWTLPLVAFHSPAQHAGTTGPETPEALQNLVNISVVDPTSKDAKKHSGNEFEEYVIGADLNIDFATDCGAPLDDDPVGMQREAEYIAEAYEALDEMGAELVGTEIYPIRTCLKQVTHDFCLSYYGEFTGDDEKDMIDDSEVDYMINEDDLEGLYKAYTRFQEGLDDLDDYINARDKIIESDFDFNGVPKKDLDAAKSELCGDIGEDLDRMMHYIRKMEETGGDGIAPSTFDYCKNSFDRIMVVQQYEDKEKTVPKKQCAIDFVEVWVVPMVAAVISSSFIEEFFWARDPKAETNGKESFDGLVYKDLTPLFEKAYDKVYPSAKLDEDKISLEMCLKVANRLSDHLPLVLDAWYEYRSRSNDRASFSETGSSERLRLLVPC